MLKLFAKAQMILWDPKHILTDLKENTEGATMIEYSLLIGLISVVLIISLAAVGVWAGAKWTFLQTTIGA